MPHFDQQPQSYQPPRIEQREKIDSPMIGITSVPDM